MGATKELGPYIEIPVCSHCDNFWIPPHRDWRAHPMTKPSWAIKSPCMRCGNKMKMEVGRYEYEEKISGLIFKSKILNIVNFHKANDFPRMTCSCVDVDMGSYCNQIILGKYPIMQSYLRGSKPNGISVDKCIADSVIYLWENNIRTDGSCCGHGKVRPYININPEDFNKAIELGFVRYEFEQEEFKERFDTITFMGSERVK